MSCVTGAQIASLFLFLPFCHIILAACKAFLLDSEFLLTFIKMRSCQAGSHVARLNFKKSCVGVYKCFTSLLEIERKFFVIVRILEKGDKVMRCEETITVLQFLS